MAEHCEFCKGTGKLGFQQETCWYCDGNGFNEENNNIEVDKEKYLILCNRHSNVYGDNFALWWGYKDNGGGYSADFRNAHLYTYEEVKDYHLGCKGDPAINLSDLGYTEEQFYGLPQDENIRVLIEKGTLNDLLGLELRKG